MSRIPVAGAVPACHSFKPERVHTVCPTAEGRKKGGGSTTPKPPPPKEGEGEITFIDGKKHYWCAKCKRWTVSHGTDTHRSKEDLQAATANLSRIEWNLAPVEEHQSYMKFLQALYSHTLELNRF